MHPTNHAAPPSDALDRRLLLGAAGLAGIAALASRGNAGPLTPPAGAVASTAKPLAEIEPRTAVNAANTPPSATAAFRITQPGSYYLTGNIVGVAGRRGVEIAANGVTLDLAGFALQGVPGSGEGVILLLGSASGITIRNGHISGWGNAGINLQAATAFNSRVEGVTVTNNGEGILVYSHSFVTGCIVNANTGVGISAIAYCVIERCMVRGNGASGIVGGDAAVITACTANENTGNGISSFSLGYVTGCSCMNNTGDGIIVGNRNRVIDNLLFGNGVGPPLAAGIHMLATSSGRNHIEGNTCSGNGRGYSAESPNNILLRNTASLNGSNWEIVANNRVLVLVAASNAAFTGNSGGTALSPASYDPNANFTI
jgi:parallel beta-helix repeat protein